MDPQSEGPELLNHLTSLCIISISPQMIDKLKKSLKSYLLQQAAEHFVWRAHDPLTSGSFTDPPGPCGWPTTCLTQSAFQSLFHLKKMRKLFKTRINHLRSFKIRSFEDKIRSCLPLWSQEEQSSCSLNIYHFMLSPTWY